MTSSHPAGEIGAQALATLARAVDAQVRDVISKAAQEQAPLRLLSRAAGLALEALWRHRGVVTVLAGMLSLTGVPLTLPTAAQACALTVAEKVHGGDAAPCVLLLPSRADHLASSATHLHWGMSAADVVRIMGKPKQVDTVEEQGGTVQVFRYRSNPIPTTVSLVDDALTGVALDVARFEAPGLPEFARPVVLGLKRAVVPSLLGAPAEDRHWEQYGKTLEQMIFKRLAMPEVSVFFIDGWAVKKQAGRLVPADIFSLALPAVPAATEEAIDACDDGWDKGDGQVRLGTREEDVRALYDDPKLRVHYSFKGHPADYAIFEAQPGRSFARFTFIDDVLTEFADGGKTPFSELLHGR